MISSDTASSVQIGILAVLSLTALLTFLGDAYTTMIALQHGFVESNPVMRFLFKKLGQPFANFVTAVFILFMGGLISAYTLNGAYLYFGIMTIAEGIRTFLNYRLLKAAKISLK